jgi:hypothetical protein
VTGHLCDACAQRPAPDTTICRDCTDHLAGEVASISAYHGLAYDLDIALAKQAKFRPSPGGRSFSDERPLLIDERASDAAGALKVVLAKWAKVIYRDTHPIIYGPTCRFCRHRSCHEIRRDFPVDSLTGIASWLKHRIRWISGHHDAAAAYREITAAISDGRHAVDRPGDRIYAGPCTCGRDLYVRQGDQWAYCHAETDAHDGPTAWPVDKMRVWMLGQVQDFIGTSTEVSAALSRLARPVTPAAIRGYVFRNKLRPVWADGRRRALYRSPPYPI